jgi:phospholipase/lecithinase/hemolysin
MYFNGSAPANVTGFVNHCDIDGSNCVESDSPDSFLWQDELHPTEQTGRLIAREFVNVLAGNSTFASYWDAPKS